MPHYEYTRNKKTNSKHGKVFRQYVLIQSLRLNGKSRQKNILYLGSQKYLADKSLRHLICKALEEKIYETFDFPNVESFYDKLEYDYKKQVNVWYAKYIEKQKQEREYDITTLSKPSKSQTAIFEEVDTSTVNATNCREVGAEYISLKTSERLKIDEFLQSKGFSRQEIELALVSIISRCVYPCSERKTAQWLSANSALWELFKTIKTPPNRFALYRIADKLSIHFNDFTTAVYQNTIDLFGLKDNLMIFDLSNTYFEGRKLASILAKFGRSKEKRRYCKLVSFSAVVNEHGFLRYSKIEKGNVTESKTLLQMVHNMRINSKSNKLNSVIVMDAGNGYRNMEYL